MSKFSKKYEEMTKRYFQIGKETGKEAADEFSAEAIAFILDGYPAMLECSDGTFHGGLLRSEDEEVRDYWEERYKNDPVLREGDERLSDAAYQHLLGWYEAIVETTQ